MRDYGKVHTSFWTSESMRGMSEDGRALALYLLTSPHGTLAGVMRLPDGYVCEDMQWVPERVAEGFRELLAKGFANRCETTKWAWVLAHFEWNPLDNPNQRKSARKIAESIPAACCWKQAFMRDCGQFMGYAAGEFGSGKETVEEGFPNQEQEQEQKQEQEQEKAKRHSSSVPEDAPGEQLELVGDDGDQAEKPSPSAAKSARLAAVTADAVAAYNAALGKPNGLLPSVQLISEDRVKQVKRCLRLAPQIAMRLHGKPQLTREFWNGYFETCANDEFASGRKGGGKGHENWTPDFEFLTRPEQMEKIFDKAMSQGEPQ